MKCVKINYTESIDNFFFEDDFMCEDDEEVEYYEDITIPDDTTWDDMIDSKMENEENTIWNQENIIKYDIPSPDPEDFSLNSLNMRENSEQLVNNFLDLDNPVLSSKMIELMKMNDFMKLFIHKITRVPDAVLYNEEETYQGFSIDESIFRKRECTDVVLMKRSYNAFKVLTSSSVIKVVAENARFIGKELLKIFHPKSEGNFNHFKPLWNHLIEITHGDIALLLTSDEFKEQPIYQMLRYIHEPAITSALISTIFLFDAKPGLQVELFTRLQEVELIETLLAMLDLNDFPIVVNATSEFLIQMIEEGSKTEDSDILLSPIQLNPSSLSVIISHISANDNEIQQHACIELLLAFLEKCIYSSDNVSLTTSSFAFSDKMPLEPLKKSVLNYLKNNIDELCQGLGITETREDHIYTDDDDDHYSVYSSLPRKRSRYRLTCNKIDLLRIIITTVKQLKKDEYEMLEYIPWKLLVQWFFENKSNNIYHQLFLKFFDFALKSNYIPILNSLFMETNLIKRFIDNFNNTQFIDCKGYIILMCNHIRFTYDSKPDCFLKSFLENNEEWEDFLPELKKATKKQIGDRPKFEYIGGTRPLPYTPKLSTHKYLAKLIKKDKELKNVDGVELNSLYAALLGYGVNEPKNKAGKSKRASVIINNKNDHCTIKAIASNTLDLISEPTLYDNYQDIHPKPAILTTTNGNFGSSVVDHEFLFNKDNFISYEI
ncbi:hypothetical protein BCR36DRAFT_326225 [Piromyces finnis]|uniref:SAPS-domain-containing protein n=1 Tax=Piromyces finnis TaxID=1754191 RepID=A0A1Y1VAL6_9FUNG|nr:hypothetical protein BCR36DRAFT_326225 [Piromyces finnis]|eukprot:ORX51138.1 hypothetical protein BCR36DRAFT_326225 [Piromyces finnis]